MCWYYFDSMVMCDDLDGGGDDGDDVDGYWPNCDDGDA
jgi:hypothetical protein